MKNFPGDEVKIANFSDYKTQLFESYQTFRYNEIACDRLTRKASAVEKFVRISTLALVTVSLATGAISFLNDHRLAIVWAAVTIVATITSLYSLIVGSAAKQIHWFGLAAKFRTSAHEVEFFSEYVKLERVTEDELLVEWQRFTQLANDLLDRAGFELPEFISRNRAALDKDLRETLQREGKLK